MQIALHFTSDPTPSLVETNFYHPLCARIVRAIRGKSDGGLLECGSFQWTSAVQAVAILLVSISIEKYKRSEAPNSVFLKGKKGSFASSLAYALAKKPSWILDMFGVDSRGAPILTRILRAINSGQKLSGPVIIGVPGETIKKMHISVSIDGIQATGSAPLSELLNKLQNIKPDEERIRHHFHQISIAAS